MARMKAGNTSLKTHDSNVFKAKTLKDSSTSFRRALGDVNRSHAPKSDDVKSLKPMLNAAMKPKMQPPQSAPRPSRPKSEKSKSVLRTNIAQDVKAIKCFVDEIEKMPLPEFNEEDELEAIWPAVERPATYIEPLREWRQWPGVPCLPDSDEEQDDDRLLNLSDSENDILESLTEHSFEEADLGEAFGSIFPGLVLEDLPLPSYQEILQQMCETSLPE